MIISYKKLNLQKLTLYKKHESVQIYILCTKEKKKELLLQQHAAQKCLSAFAYRKFTHFTHVNLHTCERFCVLWSFRFFSVTCLYLISSSLSFSLSRVSLLFQYILRYQHTRQVSYIQDRTLKYFITALLTTVNKFTLLLLMK